MVTNYPQQLTVTAGVSTGGQRCSSGKWRDHARDGRLNQLLCGLGGHDAVLHVEGKRVMMRCTSCGHDTPGWEISGRGPRRRYEGDASRHLMPGRELELKKSA